MTFPETEFKYKPAYNTGIILSVIITCFILLFLFTIYFLCYFLNAFDLRHSLNFFPSSSWTTISIVVSIISGLAFSVSYYLQQDNADKKMALSLTLITMGFIGFWLCGILVYALGPVVTHFSSITIEKTITGTKVRESGGARSPRYYYIDTPDLPEGAFANLYITESEFNSIPNNVHAHVTLKQSFFGTTIENYSFY